MIDVSVVVINYNTYALTRQCIASVYANTRNISIEVILVDNASTQINPSLFKDEFPELILVQSVENVGFAGGNNLGIQRATGRYILLLNSDTYLKDNAIHKVFDYMERTPAAGVVSARLVYPDGQHQAVAQRFPSVFVPLAEILRLQKLVPKSISGEILLGAFFDHQKTVKADWVWGAFFMFSASILNQLPGQKLDDKFFMYYEDMQWCWDIKKLGYEIHFFADAEVVHLMGGSSGAKNEMMLKNEQIFMKSNYGYLHRVMIRLVNKLL
ncbi:glycosyltransferase family 2 protein [Hymenobacter wooponensis]|uniref:Glycosyltransferase family 2 protein n=1 Tax=Hymenobacter wooponensis TaxID=1525360 RepID=A0A4Z0MV24_9BACT|nr:glycosyltransferase family 2 protein [Hymenobacter wooponensis]TGD82985.1 glycosyltransferase family 2 protein [Hymenobacter wooponensis]